jgi:hypothetical protein
MSQAPTQNGSKSSNTLDNTSSISKTERHLMSTKARMLKDNKLLSGRSTMDGTRDGELPILTEPVK